MADDTTGTAKPKPRPVVGLNKRALDEITRDAADQAHDTFVAMNSAWAHDFDLKKQRALNEFVKYIDYWLPDIEIISRAKVIYENAEEETKFKQLEENERAFDANEKPKTIEMLTMDYAFTTSTRSKEPNAVYTAFNGTKDFRKFAQSFDVSRSVSDFVATIERITFHMRNIDLSRMGTELDRIDNPILSMRENFVMKPYVHHATELMDFARGCLLEVLESKTIDPQMQKFCEDTYELVLQRSFEIMKVAEVSDSKLQRFVDNTKITGKIPQPLVRKVTDDAYKVLQRKYQVFDLEKSADELNRETNDGSGRSRVRRAGRRIARSARAIVDTELKKGIEAESFVEEAILTGHLRRNMKDVSIKEKMITRFKVLELQISGAFSRPSKAIARFTDRVKAIPTIGNLTLDLERDKLKLPELDVSQGELYRWWAPLRDRLLDRYLDGTDCITNVEQDLLDEIQLNFESKLDEIDLDALVGDPSLLMDVGDWLDIDKITRSVIEQMQSIDLDKIGGPHSNAIQNDVKTKLLDLFDETIRARTFTTLGPSVSLRTSSSSTTPLPVAPLMPLVPDPIVNDEDSELVSDPEADAAIWELLASVSRRGDDEVISEDALAEVPHIIDGSQTIGELDLPESLPTPKKAVLPLDVDPAPTGESWDVESRPLTRDVDDVIDVEIIEPTPAVESVTVADTDSEPALELADPGAVKPFLTARLPWGSEVDDVPEDGTSIWGTQVSAVSATPEIDKISDPDFAPDDSVSIWNYEVDDTPIIPAIPEIVKPKAIAFTPLEPTAPSSNGSTVTLGSTSVEIRANQILSSFDSQVSTKPNLEEANKVVRAELAGILLNVEPGYFVKNDLLAQGNLDIEKATKHFMGKVEDSIDTKLESGQDLGVNITDLAKMLEIVNPSDSGLGR